MLTANYEYSRSNGENLPLIIQMQLSGNLKYFCRNFIAFLKSKATFEQFEKLRWGKLLKLAAFRIFLTSVMVLFEIHQRFKGHFFNEVRVSFKRKIS